MAKTKPPKKGSLEPWHNITSITLGGFQVFEQLTTIPLGRLTLLFGPNSAGKSAVEDALVLIGEALTRRVLFSDQVSFDNANREVRFERLSRHWRRTGSTYKTLVPELTLGISARLSNYFLHDAMPKDWRSTDFQHEAKISLVYRLEEVDVRDGYHEAMRDVRVDVDNIGLLVLEEWKRFGVNLKHPVLSKVSLQTDFRALAKQYPKWVGIENGWIWFSSPGRVVLDAAKELNRAAFFSVSPEDDAQRAAESLKIRPGFDELADLFNTLLAGVFGYIRIQVDKVSASRTIPTSSELTHWVTDHLDPEDYGYEPLHDFGLMQKKDQNPYYRLAKSFVVKKFEVSLDGISMSGDEHQLIEGVNESLSDHLFLERGYQLNADFRVLLDLDQFASLEKPATSEAGYYPILVQVHLVDPQGRKFQFDEVGSGLGYVLPVLVSIWDPDSDSYISLIQQPELHLHPALQAALGDVINLACGGQIVIETHSEHLLLRVLKRVRQTTRNELPDPLLRLSPEEVSVVYFDPLPDGTTTAKHLRVSPDGDFLDMWPRGFFAERDRELFDE